MDGLTRCLRALALVPLVALMVVVPTAAAAGTPAAQWHLDRLDTNPRVVGTTTPDASGNGISAAVAGATLVPGRFDSAFALDGGTGQVRAGANAGLGPARLSVLAWVRRAGSPGTYRYVVARGARGCSNSSYALYTGADGGLWFYVTGPDGSLSQSPPAGAAVWDGNWHAVAGTYDGATVRLYVDGKEIGAGTPAVPAVGYGLDSDDFVIGGYPRDVVCGGLRYGGTIDEVRVYAEALDAATIASLQADPAAPLPPDPVRPPPAAPSPPVNLSRPVIGPSLGRFRCSPGTWQGLSANPTFDYEWLRRAAGGARTRTRLIVEARTQIYEPPDARFGSAFTCRVTARNAAGATSATSLPKLLTQPGGAIPFGPPYGNFRIRGIDVFQVVQPNSAAGTYGFPGAFDNLPGGGTPTAFSAASGVFGAILPAGADPQRVGYEGVTLDAGKPATAIVYVDVTQPMRFPGQPLQVSLIARYHGKQIGTTTLTTTIANPPQSSTGFVTTAERDDPQFGVQFPIPPFWLTVPASLGDSFDLEAKVGFPVGTSPLSIQECDATTVCSADDVFRLIGLPALSLTPLNVLSVELRGTGQAVGSLNPAATVMASAAQLFPGGEGLSLPPFAGSVDVSIWEDLPANSIFCAAARDLRSCRMTFVQAGLEAWAADNPRTGQDVVLGVHNYRTGTTGNFIEPGWTSRGPGPLNAFRGTPVFLVNDGTGNRPRTAAAHEFGHVLGAPHASNACGGGTGGQIGEDWTPDQIGLLQGVKFDRLAPLVGGKVDPVVDGPTALFDLMSYCGPGALPTDTKGGVSESGAWISAHNWNRSIQTMLDYERHLSAASFEARGATATAAAGGSAYAVGVVTPTGGVITRVVPPDGHDAIPAPVAASTLRLRGLDAGGAVLSDAGVALNEADEGAPGMGTFLGPVAASAATVELVRDGVVLNSVARSRPPTIALRARAAGARIRGALAVRWAASDPDGGALLADVDLSADGGRSWRTIWSGPSSGRAVVPAALLEASGRARIRVSVSDGFNEATVSSGLFRVDGPPPTVRVVRPARGERVRGGEPTLLVASATDRRRRPLTGAALTWFAGGRRLGTGARLTTALPAGRVVLTLVGRAGGRRVASRRILAVEPGGFRLRSLAYPERVRRGARSVSIRIAATTPGSFVAAGRRHRVGPRATTIVVALPTGRRVGLVRIPFRLVGYSHGQLLRGVIEVVRA